MAPETTVCGEVCGPTVKRERRGKKKGRFDEGRTTRVGNGLPPGGQRRAVPLVKRSFTEGKGGVATWQSAPTTWD